MRQGFLFIFISISSVLFAQVELSSNTLPPFGTVISYLSCPPMMIDTTIQGSDVTWNFGSLSTGVSVKTHSFMDPASTPYASNFTNANYARMVTDFGGTRYYYYDKTITYLELVGIWSSSSSNVSLTQLVFPMMLGTQHTSNWGDISISIAGIGTGTLVLPTGTYTDVVMVRRIQIDDQGTFYNFYEWYSSDNGSLLLYRMSSNDPLFTFDSGVVWNISTAVSEHHESDDLRFATPVINELELIHGSGISGTTDLLITNSMGQVVRIAAFTVAPGDDHSRLFVGDLARGCYLLTLRPRDSSSATRTIRFIKQ